jgi:ferredoxin
VSRPHKDTDSVPPQRRASLFPLLLFPVFSSLLLAAHFSCIERDALAVFCLFFPVLLFRKREWIIKVYQLYLLLGAAIWIERALFLRRLRLQEELPWLRLILILGFIAALTLLSAIILEKRKVKIRYNALTENDILKHRPGLSCTLCGDCLPVCPHRALHYKFPGLSPGTSRILFLVILVSLHAVFLGVARI